MKSKQSKVSKSSNKVDLMTLTSSMSDNQIMSNLLKGLKEQGWQVKGEPTNVNAKGSNKQGKSTI